MPKTKNGGFILSSEKEEMKELIKQYEIAKKKTDVEKERQKK